MSNRVQGARLKAAAATHARKQLGALGVSVATKAGGATFNGKQAYAYWSIDGEEVRSYGINYPAMPDNALVSRREADLISAYTLHEIGHIAFTDNKAASGAKPIIFHLWNGIEDARIEHAVIASGRAAGARSAFKRLMSKYTAAASPSFNPCNINAAPFALALVCRAAFGDGNGFAKTLLDRIPEPKRSLYANCADRAKGLTLDRNGSWGAFALAREFLDGWLAIEPDALKAPEPIQPPPGAPQPEQQQEQQEQQEADDADSAPSSFEERDSDDQGADDDNSGNSGFDWDDDGEDGNADQGADVDLDADMDSDADAGGGDGEDDGISAADLQRDMEESAEDVSNGRDDSVLFDQSEDEHDESGDGDGYSGTDTFDDEQATFDEGSVILD